ncbi:hypothetical protein BT63DRAFT_443827 [Microthyrium microscopicum]|uniref:F-box domain-containing protein n=1 Tax=Microthyrium microscopicum TaxID=703497 RepID=A0A6A6TYA8_9PEZI|nr:hypothetical protein BT63DRAFT_443827 [Microthyrium microscopicum]
MSSSSFNNTTVVTEKMGHFSFLQQGVPPEIRLMIYKLLLISPATSKLIENSSADLKHDGREFQLERQVPAAVTTDERTLWPEILATCSLFYEEAHEILYRNHTFHYVRNRGDHLADHLQSAFSIKFVPVITKLYLRQSPIAGDLDRIFGCFTSLKKVQINITWGDILSEDDFYPFRQHDSQDTRWLHMIQYFRARQPALQEFRIHFFHRICPSCHSSHESSLSDYGRWMGLSEHGSIVGMLAWPTGMEEDDDSSSTTAAMISRIGFAVDPRASFKLPLSFSIHRERMKKIKEWFGDEQNGWEWLFQVVTKFDGPPLVQMTILSNPNAPTFVRCETLGEWGHQSRVEELYPTDED